MKYQTIIEKTTKAIHRYTKNGYCNYAVIRVNGRIYHLPEIKMIALMLTVMDMTDAEYEDFCKTVVIYNNRTVKSSTDTITVKRDGGLSGPFISGLLKASDELFSAIILK